MPLEEQLLCVFPRDSEGFPLRTLLGAVRSAGHPAAVSLGIAGNATDEELERDDWSAVFLRWMEPRLHDVALIERDLRSASEETRALIGTALREVMNANDPGGQLIVAAHLRKTNAVYTLQVLPALLDQDEHDAWGALDIVLRCIAAQADGLISVPGEGYCDAEGELLLAHNEIEEDVSNDFVEEEPEQA